MRRTLLLAALGVLLQLGRAEIASSSDLNCGFSTECRWRNGTNGMEDGAEFVPSHNLEMDEFHRIAALRPEADDFFVYTYALGGRQEALLVSDVISCQLGGASIKYWYWKTGRDVSLDVCIRQPPGSRDRNTFKCYDGLSSTFAQQWIFRAIELPPVSQPFEIIFRATFTAPLDLLALDNIAYDAILCDPRYATDQAMSDFKNWRSTRSSASSFSSLPVIAWRDWQQLKTAEGPKPLMIVVGEPSQSSTANSTSEPCCEHVIEATLHLLSSTEAPTTSTTQESTSSTRFTTTPTTTTCAPSISTSAPSTTTSTTTEVPYSSSPPTSSTTMPSSMQSSSSPFPTLMPNATEATTESTDHVQNLVQFLRQVQPVLPYIPALVRTLQSVDPHSAAATGTDPLVELNELSRLVGIDLVDTSHELRRTESRPQMAAFQTAEEQRVAELVNSFTSHAPPPSSNAARYDGSLITSRADGLSLRPIKAAVDDDSSNEPKNIFGLERASKAGPAFLPSTVYPPKLVKALKTIIQRAPTAQTPGAEMAEETMDLSDLSTAEIKQLEKFHRKIFRKKGDVTRPPEEEDFADDGIFLAPPAPDAPTLPVGPPPLVVFKKSRRPTPPAAPSALPPPNESAPPSGTVSDMLLSHMDDLKSILPPEAVADMVKLREIPHLEELTRGMDISMINRPGGFAALKKEFMQRMIRRSLGLPPVDEKRATGRKPLPPPIVPIKVTRNMLMRQMKAARQRALSL